MNFTLLIALGIISLDEQFAKYISRGLLDENKLLCKWLVQFVLSQVFRCIHVIKVYSLDPLYVYRYVLVMSKDWQSTGRGRIRMNN